jgi:hypothetical protein
MSEERKRNGRLSCPAPRATRHAPRLLGLALLVALAVGLVPCSAQQIHRNSFETPNTHWVKGSADTAYEEQAHDVTDQGAHDYQRCEHLRVNARQGSHIYYQYAAPRAPVTDDLNLSLWVKGNRPGVQLLARVVLPHDRDPGSLDDCRTTLIRGELYRGPPNRWKRLDLTHPVTLLRQQQQMMQSQLGRPVNIADAYIDAVLLNVYGGPGVNEVWIDALTLGPVLDPPAGQLTGRPAGPAGQGGPRLAVRPGRPAQLVEFSGSHLLVDNRRVFFRGIRHTDTRPEHVKVLRDAGFNTLFCEHDADPAVLRQATEMGFWLVPRLDVHAEDARLASSDGLDRQMRAFPQPENVLFWNLGNQLAYEQTPLVWRSAQLVHRLDPQRGVGGDAWDGLARYSGSLNLLSVHRWPLGTGMELTQYRSWLEQRRRLANPGTFLWSWVQTHTPEWHTQLLYERPSEGDFHEPIGPQPEQIRLLTYTALGVGCRGLGFWSDRFLADSHQGRDRLLAVALLNQELDMLEPLLVTAEEDPVWIPTSSPDVQAAVLRCAKGVLVLPVWLGSSGQYVPGQAATSKLTLTVPQVPQSMQAWDVSPGAVRALRPERVAGGTKLVLPEFGLTAAVVFTSDTQLVVRFQQVCALRREVAAEWTYNLAVQELEKVVRITQELEQRGLTVADAGQLLKDARDRLARAKQYYDGRLFGEAYHESQRAVRPARILMRALWDKGTKGLDSPVSSPYAVSFYTLPRHLQFMDYLKKAVPGANALPDGDFEEVPGRPPSAWAPQQASLENDGVDLIYERVSEIPVKPPKKPPAPQSPRGLFGPKTSNYPGSGLAKQEPKAPPAAPPPPPAKPAEGKLCLKLEIRPKSKEVPPPQALERAYMAVNSPMVQLPPGSLVRISARVYIGEPLGATTDGALVFDSAGGEPLALRLNGPLSWKQFTLYRRVPASGRINVTLALTGLGSAYFDDVRIEPLIWSPERRDNRAVPVPVAAR